MRSVLRLALVAVVAGSGFVSNSARAAEKVRFLLDWAFQGPQALFTYTLEKGYFANQNLDVTIERGFGSTDSVTKLASGAYDVAFGDINSMMEYNVKNPDKRQLIAVMMIYDRAPLAVVTIDPAIKTLKDLEGKRLTTTRGAADLNLFPIFARNAGLDTTKISFVYVAPNLREPLLIKQQAEASTAFYHTSYMSLKALGVDMSKFKSFAYSDYGVEIYGNAVMTSKALAADKPEVLRGITKALTQALRDVVQSPEVAIPSIKQRDPTSNEAIELERLQIVNEQSVVTPATLKSGVGGIDTARMEKAIDQVKEALELPRRPSVDEVFTDKFLPPASERMLSR
jgi:NitT/TauT family transport system substrate-binding protein